MMGGSKFMSKVYKPAEKGATREQMFENIKANEATMRQREYNVRYRTKGLDDPTDQILGAYGQKRYDYKLKDMKDPDYTYTNREIYNYSKRLASDLNSGVGLFKKTNVGGVTIYEPKMGEMESISQGLKGYNEQVADIGRQVDKRLAFKGEFQSTVEEYKLYNMRKELARAEKYIRTRNEAAMNFKHYGETISESVEKVEINPAYGFSSMSDAEIRNINSTHYYPGQITAPQVVNPTERANQIIRLANSEAGSMTPRQKMQKYKDNYLKALQSRIDEFTAMQDIDARTELMELRNKIMNMSIDDFSTMYHLDLLANPDEWYKEVTAGKIISKLKTSLDIYRDMGKAYKKKYNENIGIKYPTKKLEKTVSQYAQENKKVLEKFGTLKLKKR